LLLDRFYTSNVERWFVAMLLVSFSSLLFSAEDDGPANSARCLLKNQPRFHVGLLAEPNSPSIPIQSVSPPSKARAFLLSLALPGSGEYYAGSKKMAKIFFCAETALWAAFASFRIYGSWKEQDYQHTAVSHAGVTIRGKDHDYFVNIEKYDNIRAYNHAMLQERNVAALYPEDGSYDWDWDNDASRSRFRELRIASDNAFNRSIFVIGGIVLNHLVSGIDALRLAREAEKRHQSVVRIGVAGLPNGGAVMTLQARF